MSDSTKTISTTLHAKLICDKCVGEVFLKGLIAAKGVSGSCSYCDSSSKTFTIEELANLVERAFEEHYERTSTEPEGYEAVMQSDRESDYEWERSGQQVLYAIAEAAQIEDAIAIDLLAILGKRHFDMESAKMGEECEFDSESYYAEKDPGCHEYSYEWTALEHRLKAEARFFSRSAKDILASVFFNLKNLKTHQGAPIVVKAGPDAEIKFLHRARVFAAENEQLQEALKFPWEHLAPPPMRAASAGRMNAQGISVFYGAVEASTALAEVRPPVGSQVVVAKFAIIRPLQLLDVAALESVTTPGSIFDPTHLEDLQRAKFLQILSSRISRPIMPNEEALEYLVTQVVADYLASEARLDGIIYPSVQVDHAASNVVLFHDSSLVEEVLLPENTNIEVCTEQYSEEGITPDYLVTEVILSTQTATTPCDIDQLINDLTPMISNSYDYRTPSLKIDLNSVTIHHINAVRFTSEEYLTSRQRIVKTGKQNLM